MMFSILGTPSQNIYLTINHFLLCTSFPCKSACLEESCLIDKGGNSTDIERYLSLEKILHMDSKDSFLNQCSRSFKAEPLNTLQRTSYFRLAIICQSRHFEPLPPAHKTMGFTVTPCPIAITHKHTHIQVHCPISHIHYK